LTITPTAGKRVVSGIKPSGDMTIGNYLGAMKRWPENQDKQESFFFIANLHAITVRQEPEILIKRSVDIAAWLLAVGVDPDRSTIFIQSMIPAHSEIMWILNNYVTMGELGKMTQFKDKSVKAGREGQFVGLFAYPVLMAGDVLLYDADEIPVGDDQVQHVELSRNIAQRFNNIHGETFKLPRATVSKEFSRILSLNDPSKKMSKSETEDINGFIALEDPPDLIIKKFKRAVTDSGNEILYREDKPAISNLLGIYSGFSGKRISDLEKEYDGIGYGQFKQDLGELVADKLNNLQQCFKKVRDNDEMLWKVIHKVNETSIEISKKKISEVKNKLGLL
jgi:tryptophanyl-tRNA synthetase